MASDSVSWQASYEDPLRCRLPGTDAEICCQGEPRVEEFENDLCSVKFVMMHKPTHKPELEKTGRYPFSAFLNGKRRLWEFRLQLRLKRPPQGQVFFGVELDHYAPVSGLARQGQKALVAACTSVVGDCYHTNGDDPATVHGECEAPAFVMPLWAFDQFEVSEPGQEPSLSANLEGVGMRRTDNLKEYIKALRGVVSSFSVDKVYTFCFWGVSQFLDVMRWEVTGGIIPGMKIDFDKLCGSPPVFLTFYDMANAEQGADQRHLASRKSQYLRIEVWSALRPPPPGRRPPQPRPVAPPGAGGLGLGGYGATAAPEAPTAAPAAAFEDLLGLEVTAAASGDAKLAATPPARVETTDLLGLM